MTAGIHFQGVYTEIHYDVLSHVIFLRSVTVDDMEITPNGDLMSEIARHFYDKGYGTNLVVAAMHHVRASKMGMN